MTSPTADWSAFPQGYSLLLNEKAQFPQDLSCWRTRIDDSRQLFADTFWIARGTNLERRLHEVRKHPANPLVEDLWACWVHPEPEGGYRLYANGWRGRLAGAPEPAEARERIVWTARSGDGLDWRFDPDPVLCRDHASAPWRPLQGQLHGLLFEPWEPDPERRWKMIILDRGRPRQPPGETPFTGPTVSIALYTSPDGRRWTWQADTSLLRKGSAGLRHTGSRGPLPGGPRRCPAGPLGPGPREVRGPHQAYGRSGPALSLPPPLPRRGLDRPLRSARRRLGRERRPDPLERARGSTPTPTPRTRARRGCTGSTRPTGSPTRICGSAVSP